MGCIDRSTRPSGDVTLRIGFLSLIILLFDELKLVHKFEFAHIDLVLLHEFADLMVGPKLPDVHGAFHLVGAQLHKMKLTPSTSANIFRCPCFS